jgi:hypothetical protein
VRIEIAFDGGQITGALVAAKSADERVRAPGGAPARPPPPPPPHGRYLVPLKRVVYVKRFSRESRVGFG